MRTADLRNNGPVVSGKPAKASKPQKRRLVFILTIAVLLAGVVIYLLIPKGKTPEPIPGVLQEVVGKNKVLLRDFENRKWLTYWKEYAEMLGDPLESERPLGTQSSCIRFVFHIVCHSNNQSQKGTIWEFQPLLLGVSYLPPTIQPNDQAELAPIVQSYMMSLEQKGIDRFYFLGAVQSPAFCVDNQCMQVFQRAVLTWNSGSVRPEDIKRERLGEKAKVS